MGLACSCHAVSEAGSIESVAYIVDQSCKLVPIDHEIITAFWEYFIKGVAIFLYNRSALLSDPDLVDYYQVVFELDSFFISDDFFSFI